MDDAVEKILECLDKIEKEINRSLTTEEIKIVRISFLFGQAAVHAAITKRTIEVEKQVKQAKVETKIRVDKIESLQKRLDNKPNIDSQEAIKAKSVVDALWAELGDVIVDKDDNIELGWKHFPAGTNKLTIWHWIEETYDVSIAEDLMNSITG